MSPLGRPEECKTRGGERATVKALLERLARVGTHHVAIHSAGRRTSLGQDQLLDSLAANKESAQCMMPGALGVNLTLGIARNSLSWESLSSSHHLSRIDRGL